MRRLLGRAVLAAAVALLALGPAAVGHADTASGPGRTPATADPGAVDQAELDKVLEQVRSELAESSEAMVRAYADLRLADQALPGARATATQTQELLAEARKRQAATARARGEAQVRYMLSTQDAEAQAAEVAEQQARIGRLARAVYQGGGAFGGFSALLEARSPSDLAERMVALRAVASSQRSALADLAQVQSAYGARTDDLEQVRDQLARADQQAQRDLAKVSELAQQAASAAARVGALVSARKAALAAAAQAQQQEDVAHAQQTGTSTQLQSQLADIARRDLGGNVQDGSTVPARAGTLGWPAQGPVTSPFGMRVHPVTGVYKLHTGTDLGVPCGTPVHASLAGRVIEAGWNSAYGWRTVISHGVVDGVVLTTTYNHQTHLDVTVGDQVAAGQVIGTSGTTGFSTGCHLHFELYVNSALRDPEPWLPPH